MTTEIYTGSCLCKAIRFEIKNGIRNIIYCHCSQCRKAQGSAFATNGIVNADDFTFTSGEELLTEYAVSDDQSRYFCSRCGSPIMSRRKSKPDQVRIRLGTIDDAISERPCAHIFADSKANWEDIEGELPQYAQYEPGR